MPDQHSAGYHVDYQRARRAADRRLRDQHPDEWRTYFDEERNQTTRPDEYQQAWAAGEAHETEKEQEKAEMSKVCEGCHDELPTSEFPTDRRFVDNRSRRCHTCQPAALESERTR